MKRSIVVIGVLVAIFGIAPAGLGFWAEARMEAQLQHMSRSGQVSITVLKVQHGWFSSIAEVEVEVNGEAAAAFRNYQEKAKVQPADMQSLSVTIRNRIHHGPIAFAAFDGGRGLLPALAVIDSDVIGYGGNTSLKPGQVPLSIRTRLGFLGGGETRVAMPKSSGTMAKDKANWKWEGLKGRFTYSSDLARVRGRLSAPRLEISSDEGRFIADGLSMNTNTHRGLENLSLGDMSLTLAQLSFEPTVGKRVVLQDASFTANSEAGQGVIHSRADVRLKSIQVADLNLGPAVYSMALRNLDAKAIAKIDKALQDVRKQASAAPQQRAIMLSGTVFGVLPQLLERVPVLEIRELSLDSPYGKVQGKGKLTVDASDPVVLGNPLMLKNSLIANVDFEIPQRFLVALEAQQMQPQAGQTPEQLEATAKERVQSRMSLPPVSNFLVLEAGVYRFNANLSGGRLTVNGREVGPGMTH